MLRRHEELLLVAERVHAGAPGRELGGEPRARIGMERRVHGDERHAPVRRIDERRRGRLLQVLAGAGVRDARLVERGDRHEQPLLRVVERVVVRGAAAVEAVLEQVRHHVRRHARPGAAAPCAGRAGAVVHHALEVHEPRVA